MSLVYIGYVPHPAILIPEIGRGEEKKCQKTIDAFDKVAGEIVKLGVETVLIVTPHTMLNRQGITFLAGDFLSGSFKQFGAPHLKFGYEADVELRQEIEESFPEATPVKSELDHGVLVPLYFLNKAGWQGKLVVLGMPLQKAENYGRQVGQILNDSPHRCAILASGDLSHRLKEEGPYGFHPSGPKLDNIIVRGLKRDTTMVRGLPSDLLEEAGECGYRSLLFALGAREGEIKVLSYEGPFGVGYLVAEIYRSSPIAGYARQCLTYHLTAQAFDKLIVPGEPLLKEKRACFVTIKKDGVLRGCIGTVQPVRENLALEIKHNAIAAGTQDPRFWPVEENELPLLRFSVDVLGDLEKISGLEELDPQKYGVVVRQGGKAGLLLPRLEGVNSAQEQLDIAMEKAGIFSAEQIELWRFEVERYYE
jgi:AmmeMemoRadiSam system protein A